MQRIPVDLRSQGHPRRAQPPIPTPSAQSDRVRAETFSEIKETSRQLGNATKTSQINSQRSRGEEAAGWEAELYLYLQHVAAAPPPAPAVMATQSLLPARGRGTCVVLRPGDPTRRPVSERTRHHQPSWSASSASETRPPCTARSRARGSSRIRPRGFSSGREVLGQRGRALGLETVLACESRDRVPGATARRGFHPSPHR